MKSMIIIAVVALFAGQAVAHDFDALRSAHIKVNAYHEECLLSYEQNIKALRFFCDKADRALDERHDAYSAAKESGVSLSSDEIAVLKRLHAENDELMLRVFNARIRDIRGG